MPARLLTAAAVSGAVACAGASADADAPARRRPVATPIGARVPAYQAVTFGGDSLQLGRESRVVLLNVWATWCASCKEEFALMDTLLERHGARGLRVVAVSVDVGSDAPVRRTAAQYGVTFEIAHDPDGEIERRFPAIGVPASYLIDRDGTLLWKHVGVLPAAVDSVIAEALASADPAH
jgi:cytochrome c-type biogenesis protein